jgi:hypothetical protein
MCSSGGQDNAVGKRELELDPQPRRLKGEIAVQLHDTSLPHLSGQR